MKVLYTTPILEYPPAGGPQLRISNSIKALSTICDLHIIHRAPHPSPSVSSTSAFFCQYASSYSTIYESPTPPSNNRIKRNLLRILSPRSSTTLSFLASYIRREGIEIVWLGYGNLSHKVLLGLRRLFPDIKIICDTDSVWSRFVLREIPYSNLLRRPFIYLNGKRSERRERQWVKLADITTAVSKIDAEYYRSISPRPHLIRTFSNVIDLRDYSHPNPVPSPSIGSPSLILSGSFGPLSSMNIAASWVIDEILPRLKKSFPDIHLYLVGRNSDVEFSHLASSNISCTGTVDSVLPYLLQSDVSIVPLKFESGTRFKILEAGACRVPVVSTTLGAEGLDVINGEHILIADDPDSFASSILSLLQDHALVATITDNCYDLVSNRYSISNLVCEAQSILQELANG